MKSRINKHKILVVEDDIHIRSNLVEFLLMNEFEVDSVNNGIEGLAHFGSFNPDLIICDIMMPEMDGFTFLDELQRKFPLSLTIFIFLTAANSQADQRKGMNLGADDYIIKPFIFSELLQTIEKKFEKNATKIKGLEKVSEKLINHTYFTPYQEFNTCLSDILTGSQLLLEEANTKLLNFETRSIPEVINKSAIRLSRAINNFILYNELLSKKYHPSLEEIPASFIANTFVHVATNYNRASDLVLSVDGSFLITDRFLLKRVLEELAENAFKYSRQGETIALDIFLLPEGAKIEIAYPNHKKFNSEKLKNAAPYEQFSSDNQLIDGLGLGLYLSKVIMEILLGKLVLIDTNQDSLKFQIYFSNNIQNI
jgi:DNA-binding response OmpR family regulator